MLRNSEHPPLMKGTSWTLAAPFKEQKHDRTPSESIANVYTPTAMNLKMKNISKMQKPKSKCKCEQSCRIVVQWIEFSLML